MTQSPDVSDDGDQSGASKDDEDNQDGAVADPLIERAEAGWRLGWAYLDQADAGAEPDPDRLDTAIEHLEVAVLDGIDGVVLRDPELLQLLGLLLLLVQGEAEEVAEAVEEARVAFAEGLDCPGLEEPLRLSLLDGILLACRRWVALLEPGADVYHPTPELAAACDALMAAAETLFLAVPPDHENASNAATALIRALATRLIGHTGPEQDASDLLRLVRARPDVRQAEGVEDAGTLVMLVSQALLVAFEHDGREELLLATADLVAEAQSWADLPGSFHALPDPDDGQRDR